MVLGRVFSYLANEVITKQVRKGKEEDKEEKEEKTEESGELQHTGLALYLVLWVCVCFRARIRVNSEHTRTLIFSTFVFGFSVFFCIRRRRRRRLLLLLLRFPVLVQLARSEGFQRFAAGTHQHVTRLQQKG